MSPPSENLPSTPESKNTSGLASVFKNLTGSRNRHAAPAVSSSASTSAAPALLPTSSSAHNNLSSASLSPPNAYAGSLSGSLGRRGSRANFSTISSLTPPSPDPDSFMNSARSLAQMQSIQKDKPIAERTAAAEALRHDIAECTPNNVVQIWGSSKDLIEKNNPPNTRKAGYDLLEACLKHSAQRSLDRRQFFYTLSSSLHPDDFYLQLSLMVDLTNKGRNLVSFESLILPLLTEWLKFWCKASKVAARKKTGAPSGESTNLAQLFVFIADVIKFNFNSLQEGDVRTLLDELVSICSTTTTQTDIRNSINVMDTIITYGFIPQIVLVPCIETLCRTYSTLKELADPSWLAMSNLCRSHVEHATLKALFDLLRKPTTGGTTNTARGALAILEKLMLAKGSGQLVLVPIAQLMECLKRAVQADAPRLNMELLKTIRTILSDDALTASIVEEDCSNMLSVLSKCLEQADTLMEMQEPMTRDEKKDRDIGHNMSQVLNEIFAMIEDVFSRFEIIEKERIIAFFFNFHERLSDSCAHLLISYYIDEHLCYPSNQDWLKNSGRLVTAFLNNRKRQASVRLQVLKSMREVYETVKDVTEQSDVDELIWSCLENIQAERDTQVLEVLVNFAVEVADEANNDLFDRIFDSLQRCLPLELGGSPMENGHVGSRPASSATLATVSSNPSSLDNIATRAIIHIFMRAFSESAYKAQRAFESVMKVARSDSCATDARLSAMKLLFRLRCDSNGAIIIVSQLDSDGLAAALNRTTDTITVMKDIPEEVPPSRHSRLDDNMSVRSSRSTSMGHPHSYLSRSTTRSTSAWGGTARVATKSSSPLWMYPDENALPQDAPTNASRLIYAFDLMPKELIIDADEQRTTLSFNIWLEILIAILQNGGDWEIYSHVLVHLGSQLTNHRLFQTAIPQIKFLRNVLCEQLKNNSFHEPPLTSGLRKADVAICLFHTLTMNLSYFKHFSTGEQDDIVRVFSSGLTSYDRTAKRCIHALTICCHELTGSVSKSMTQILPRMGSIITQAHLAVHVLEFLAGLARVPKIYVNFREEDYRTVFQICFRYLQYAREQKLKGTNSGPTSARTSFASGRQSANLKESHLHSVQQQQQQPATVDDLPQYVYALAYHVITFWFMSLKVLDRSKHVSWITRSLVTVDQNGRETIDEQSQVTIDMMQRIAYSDFDESIYNPNFAQPSDGEVRKKSWLDGYSIVTIETATATGLSQITKRQPSGTSHSIFRLERAPLPQHQITSESDTWLNHGDESSRIAMLPSYVFLQMSATSFRLPEALRPIPLPDDDATARAISMFDRNSTVDGHKIGIIYVGENQTTEQEILSNVMGSNDFTEFLGQMGSLTRLKGAKFNTQGLDRENDSDGQFTYCWRDRVTEIVFHITTMMPTDSVHDPYCINKKRHTGNDFVNIIFNNSGQPFRFDTFPSEFNYVNIVVTPESRVSFVATRTNANQSSSTNLSSFSSPHAAHHSFSSSPTNKPFYKVQVMSKSGFPEVSPAAETKIISGESLPAFVRLIALNASVFSLVWSTRDTGNENISSWRNRLRAILKLRDRYSSNTSSFVSGGGAHTPTNNFLSNSTLATSSTMAGGIPSSVGSNATATQIAPPLPPGASSSSGRDSASLSNYGGGGSSSGASVSAGSTIGGGGGAPSVMGRDSMSLRRTSAATTFMTTDSHRSSMHSTLTEADTMTSGDSDSVVDGFDFSKWS